MEASTASTPSKALDGDSANEYRSELHEERQEESTSKRVAEPVDDETLWKKSTEVDAKGRDEEFDDYLADLLL